MQGQSVKVNAASYASHIGRYLNQTCTTFTIDQQLLVQTTT